MNLISLVVVVLRLSALKLLFIGVSYIVPQLFLWQGMSSFETSGGLSDLPWGLVGGLVVCAGFMWIGALPVARLATHGVSRDISLGNVTVVDCYALGFMFMGLYFAVGQLPGALNLILSSLKSAANGSIVASNSGMDGYNYSVVLIPFVLGILLFWNSRSWAEKVVSFRAGQPSPPRGVNG